MKLSTRSRYGTRFMIELAMHYGEGPIDLKDIAHRQDMPEKYLGNLILPLKTAGLIHSTRGAHGGYALSRPPASINMSDILGALEGSLSLADCVDDPRTCPRSGGCPSRDVWLALSEKMVETLKSMSLKELAERENSKNRTESVYYI
jgi:Rrf2 family protein